MSHEPLMHRRTLPTRGAAWFVRSQAQSLCNAGQLSNTKPFDTPFNQNAALIVPQTPADCASYLGQLW